MHFAAKKVFAPRRELNRPSPLAHPVPPVANTNIVSIDLGELATKVDLLAGDPACCGACGAIFNSFSKPAEEQTNLVWTCEFCDHRNTIELEQEEFPKADTCDYMLSPPSEESKVSNEEQTIVFVIDVSGSMCVTTELTGTLKLRGQKNNDSLYQSFGNINDQYLPGQRRDITYVSRLQCVQAAIEAQLDTLQKEFPKSKVGLVCFNNEVMVIGDGSKPPVTITGDKLFNQEALLECGSQYQISDPISNSKANLINKLYNLDESGSTALGPAVVVAVGMCKNLPGSKIVLATDGLANTGIGALDYSENNPDVANFYVKVAEFAKQKATTISVIGIRGDHLNMNIIGKLSDITQGDIDLVDPVNITKNFASILEAKLVATNVEVKLFLHKGFAFPEDDNWKTGEPEKEKEKEPKIQLFASRNIGNAFSDTEITAQFEQKEELELSKLFGNADEKRNLPFQVQITYTALNGMKCLRCITKTRELSRDINEVQMDLDVAVLGMHANDLTARYAQQGDFGKAAIHQAAYGQLIQENAQTEQEKTGFTNWSFQQPSYAAFSAAPVPQQMSFNAAPRSARHPSQFIPQQMPQAQPMMAPPQPSSGFGSYFGGLFGSSNPPPQPQQQMQMPQPQQQMQMTEQLEDEMSNACFQNRNARNNKKAWGSERKF